MNTTRTQSCCLIVALAVAFPAFAQDEPKTKDPTGTTATQKLPADQPKLAQTTAASPSTATAASAASMPSEAEMMKMMMEMGKLNENHKLLGELAGDWDYSLKMWMDPKGQPQ